MPRARLLATDIGNNYRVAALPYEPHDAQKFFTWMFAKADREGRLPADPKLLSKIVAPLCDYSAEEVQQWLDLMEAQKDDETGYGLIERYEVKGHKYLWIPGWDKHQPAHLRKNETPSNIPPPDLKEGRSPSKPVAAESKKTSDILIPTPFEIELLDVIKSIPGWQYQENEDLAWLRALTQDFQNVTVENLKACGDFHSENPRSKGPWKSRIRNWLKKEKPSGTHRGSPRQIPKKYKTPDEHREEYHRTG